MAAEPDPLAALRGLGPRSAAMLRAVGIEEPARLREIGAVHAWRRVRDASPSGRGASLNLLWALVGAVEDRDWRAIAREERLRVLTEVEAADEFERR